MMRTIRMITFGVWMYAYILYLWPYYRRIRKYRAAGDVPGEIEAIRQYQHKWGSGVLRHYGVRLHVKGVEKVPDRPVLFVSNHQSYADIPIVVAAVNRQAGYVAKEELEKLPIFGKCIEAVRSVFIKRNDARASLRAIEAGIELLERGFSLGIFPEGTRSKGPIMHEFKKGSLKLATKTGVPVVPMAISGSYRTFEEKGRPAPTDVQIEIMDPIYTETLSREQKAELGETVEEMIRAKLTELQNQERA